MKLFVAKAVSSLFPFRHHRDIVRNAIKHDAILDVIKQYYRNWKNRPKEDSFENFLSLCAIAKNEGSYFQEWIEYHLLIGVEKFYIYDNDSDDNTYDVLKPYIDQGIVEYIPFPGEKMQSLAYKNCIKKCTCKTKWLAILDLDEFIVPVGGNNIKTYLKEIPNDISQVIIRCRPFGSSHHKKRPKGLVIEEYTYRSSALDHHKSIIKPYDILLITSPHHSCVMYKTIGADTNDAYNSQKEKFRINHYLCKSKEEFQERCEKGDAWEGIKNNKHVIESFQFRDKNEVYDDITLQYVDKVKEQIEKRKALSSL